MLTTDKNDSNLNKVKDNGQNEAYLVLSDEERAKGFVRPIRTSYIHIGRKPIYKALHRYLTDEEKKENPGYVALVTILVNEDGSFKGGRYVTAEELEAWQTGNRISGCGALTTMNQTIAETYARNPKFYRATFCVGCGKHLPVHEFVWDGTDEIVGS